MKNISSTSDLLSIRSDLAMYILKSCPWMSKPWVPEGIGHEFNLDDRNIEEVPSTSSAENIAESR